MLEYQKIPTITNYVYKNRANNRIEQVLEMPQSKAQDYTTIPVCQNHIKYE